MFHHAPRREVECLGTRRNRRRKASTLLFDRAEKCRELIKIILAPFFVWVMVAFCTFHAHAEEKLADHGGEFRWFPPVAINHGRTLAMIRAFGEQDFPHEPIVRFVLPE